jgi:PAS domain S-box-containing protein
MSHSQIGTDQARHELYEIMKRDVGFEEKTEEALELGRGFLGVDNGHVARIDDRRDYWETIASTDPPDGRYPAGLSLDLATTYCRRTIQRGSPVALHDAPEQGWADDPAFETHGLHCYHGSVITLDDEPYGTVCFVSEEPREDPFDDGETMFAELVARLLEHELERRRHEVEFERRANLINVLNRILRHNLRNDLTVVRGRATMIADRLEDAGDAEDAEAIVRTADHLIDLSEEARELESIVVSEFDRERIDAGSLARHVVGNVADEYPGASFAVEGAEDVTVSAMPNLEAAVHELVENAAKHAGASPDVAVSVAAGPETVEIHVSDDGPGLPDIERQALRDGVETPMAHGIGLGLWLVYWIVTSHEGTIDAEASDDGTRMMITLPRRPTDPVVADRPEGERGLERIHDRFRAAFDEAPDAMAIVDDDGRPVDVNGSATDLFGVPEEELLGRSLDEFTPWEFDVGTGQRGIRVPGRQRGTFRLDRAEGPARTVEYAATADVVPGLHLAVMRDVTSR